MIRATQIIAAEKIIIDKEDNKVSLFNIIENLESSSFPLFFPRFAIITYLVKEEGDVEQGKYDLKISLNQKNIIESPIDYDFQGKLGTRSLVNINGLIFPSPGVVKIDFFIDGKLMNGISFKIDQAKVIST